MIKRALLSELTAHLEKKEISLIIGPRQSGKTTLMSFLDDNLKKQNKSTLFLNYDIESDREFFYSQEKLVRKIKLEFGQEKGYVFLDEIQRKENAGLFLKGLYDMNLGYKFIVSGSGSVELKEKIHESLAGRKRIFELDTLSFFEFVDYKTKYKYADRLDEFFAIEKDKAKLLFEEYMNFGGYPKVVLEEKEDEKRKVINEIYQSYLERDISYLLGVKKADDFTRLFRLIAAQIGNLTNISELASVLGIAAPTVKNYLWYMEKTYILSRVPPYFKNIRKEISKAPVYYFRDLGLLNYATGNFGRLGTDSDHGFVFENFVFNTFKERIRNSAAAINFWRTKDGAEVDFVIDSGGSLIPVEVKKQNLKRPKIGRSLRSFIDKYAPKKAFMVNMSFKDKRMVGNTIIYFIPYYEINSVIS